jgi:hypothetical protein
MFGLFESSFSRLPHWLCGDRCAPQKHVWRAQIILATADGCGTTEIMRRSGKAKPVGDHDTRAGSISFHIRLLGQIVFPQIQIV